MAIYDYTDSNIKRASEILNAGGVVSFPTETVYGLGADVFNAKAVAKIFEVKERPFFDPLIVHLYEKIQVEDLAKSITPMADILINHFWPGPLTIVTKKNSKVPDLVTSGLDTVALRIPNHPVALQLLKETKTPIAAPSANPFGYLSPTTAKHVDDQLGGKIDMIIDGGSCDVGVESTIINVDGEKGIILRLGGTSVEDIESVIGTVDIGYAAGKPEAPGQLPFHYSPLTPVEILNTGEKPDFTEEGVVFLLEKEIDVAFPEERCEILSKDGDKREIAANLFSALHRLDKRKAKKIVAEPIELNGLGKAIMDRLKKASKRRGVHER